MTPTTEAAVRGLLTTAGTIAAVGAVVALAGGAQDRGPCIVVLVLGLLAAAAGALWPTRRRPSGPQSPAPRTSRPPALSVTDVVDKDGSTVLSGQVVVVAYDPASPQPPRNRSTYVTRRHGRGTPVDFALVRLPDRSLRAYVLAVPSYGSRPSGAHETHRLRDQHGRVYVCWDTRIDRVEQIMWAAREWAERTVRYIEHGTAFEVHDPEADDHVATVERENRSRSSR